jgi:hypothetical protein
LNVAGNATYFNNDVVPGCVCFSAKNVNFVNADTPQAAQDFADEGVLHEFFAAAGMQTVTSGHGG